MNTRTIIIQTLLLIFPFMLFAESRHLSHIRIGNKICVFDERDTLQVKDKMEKHISIINNIDSVALGNYSAFNKSRQSAIVDSVEVTIDVNNYSDPKTRYKMKKTIGNVEYEFWDDNTVYSLNYTYNTRNIPKREELEKLRARKADLSKYPIIPESIAVQSAITLLNTIMGVENATMYDSMRVNIDAKGYMNMSYLIQFEIKVKNDISNAGYVCIVINAFDGKIDSYRGTNPQLSKHDYEYTPSISKQTVLEMFLSECSKSNINIEISNIALHKFYPKDSFRWHWRIYGFNKDKPGTTASLSYIDSETGEVIKKNIK